MRKVREGIIAAGDVEPPDLPRITEEELRSNIKELYPEKESMNIWAGIQEEPPTATIDHYMFFTNKMRYETELNRSLEELESSGFIEGRKGKGEKKGRRNYEYRTSEDFGELFKKSDHSDFIRECPTKNVRLWSDEATVYCSKPIGDTASPGILDSKGRLQWDLEGIVEEISILWWRHRKPRRELRNQECDDEKPRVVIVLDFNPEIQRETGDTEEPIQATSGRPPTAHSRPPMM